MFITCSCCRSFTVCIVCSPISDGLVFVWPRAQCTSRSEFHFNVVARCRCVFSAPFFIFIRFIVYVCVSINKAEKNLHWLLPLPRPACLRPPPHLPPPSLPHSPSPPHVRLHIGYTYNTHGYTAFFLLGSVVVVVGRVHSSVHFRFGSFASALLPSRSRVPYVHIHFSFMSDAMKLHNCNVDARRGHYIRR